MAQARKVIQSRKEAPYSSLDFSLRCWSVGHSHLRWPCPTLESLREFNAEVGKKAYNLQAVSAFLNRSLATKVLGGRMCTRTCRSFNRRRIILRTRRSRVTPGSQDSRG